MIKLQSFILLVYFEMILKRKGLKNACERIQSIKTKKNKNDYNEQKIVLICSTVNHVINKNILFPHAECLHKTLVGYHILKHRGVNIEFCLGVSSEGNFMSHAWLEFDGRVINDDQKNIKKYNKIMTF